MIWYRQYQTWVGHAALGVFGPAVVGVIGHLFGQDPLQFAASASLVNVLYFALREIRDVATHYNHYDSPMDPSGVTPRTDTLGDMLGPLTATLCYTAAFMLSSL